MKAIVFGALVLVAMASAAFADEASDYLKAAGDEADALVACLQQHVNPELKSSKPADQVADEAMAACDDKLGAIRVALMGPPTNLSADKAASETQVLKDGYRQQVIESINATRGQ